MAPPSAPAPARPGGPFWQFANDLYARPGVRDACLALQDDAGQDVMTLLFLCWVGASGGGRLDQAAHDAVASIGAGWSRTVTGGLRRIRRVLADGALADEAVGGMVPPADARAFLRREILALELRAERETALLLQAAVPLEADPARGEAIRGDAVLVADAAANLVAGWRRPDAGGAPSHAHRRRLAVLLTGCFPEAEPAWIDDAIKASGAA